MPQVIGDLTPGESRTLLEAIDYNTDRVWEKLIFLRTHDGRAAKDLLDLNYPHFRNEKKRIVKIIRAPSRRAAPR